MASITASITDRVLSWLRGSPSSDASSSRSCAAEWWREISPARSLEESPSGMHNSRISRVASMSLGTRYSGSPGGRHGINRAPSASAKDARLLNSVCAMARRP